jgi:hypothetical protein
LEETGSIAPGLDPGTICPRTAKYNTLSPITRGPLRDPFRAAGYGFADRGNLQNAMGTTLCSLSEKTKRNPEKKSPPKKMKKKPSRKLSD